MGSGPTGLAHLCLQVSEDPLVLHRLSVGVPQLDLHLVKVRFHLLPESDGLAAAPDLCLQIGLQCFQGALVAPPGGRRSYYNCLCQCVSLIRLSPETVHLLVLLCNPALNLRPHLLQLHLAFDRLTLLVLQSSLPDTEEIVSWKAEWNVGQLRGLPRPPPGPL